MTITTETVSYELHTLTCDRCKQSLEGLISIGIVYSHAKQLGWHLNTDQGDLCSRCYDEVMAEQETETE